MLLSYYQMSMLSRLQLLKECRCNAMFRAALAVTHTVSLSRLVADSHFAAAFVTPVFIFDLV